MSFPCQDFPSFVSTLHINHCHRATHPATEPHSPLNVLSLSIHRSYLVFSFHSCQYYGVVASFMLMKDCIIGEASKCLHCKSCNVGCIYSTFHHCVFSQVSSKSTWIRACIVTVHSWLQFMCCAIVLLLACRLETCSAAADPCPIVIGL